MPCLKIGLRQKVLIHAADNNQLSKIQIDAALNRWGWCKRLLDYGFILYSIW